MEDVFISYARSSGESARRIAGALRAAGYSIWIDDDLPAHRDFPTVIEQHLRAAKVVLVLWSADAAKSRWVPAEADVAYEAGTLIQLTLDGAMPPLPFNRLQCVRLQDCDFGSAAWQKILDSIAELVSGRPFQPARNETAQPAAAPAAREPLLAVLAFDNLSADPQMAYFSDGLSEEIQQTVTRASDLRVVARSSSFQFRGPDKAVQRVASQLSATHLLDGSVRFSGTRVRITANLVECAGGTTLWTDRFDGDLADAFALQEKIAADVAQALKTTLAARTHAEPSDPVVYETFLKARGIISEASGVFDDAAAAAVPLLEQVVRAAPDHAPAWELLAKARAWSLRSVHRQEAITEGRSRVMEAAETALRLDPRRGGAFGALAMLEPWGAYAAREKLLQKALAASPNDAGALTDMSSFCWSVGRFRDALRYAEQACELNPLMPVARLHVAQMRTYVGDYEASIRMHQELHRRWPTNFAVLTSLLNFSSSLGFWAAHDEAAAGVERFEGREAASLRATLEYTRALASTEPGPRQQFLERCKERLARTGTLPMNYVESLSFLNLTDEAFALAEQASFDHMFDADGPLPSGVFPGAFLGRWSALNKEPRFVDLCRRLGLCAYWIATDHWPDCRVWTPYDFKAEVRRHMAGRS